MHQTISSDPSPLQKAAEAFAQWRSAKKGRGRIPETLWSLACRAAQAHGVSKTAHTLRLDYYRLKRRLEAGDDPASPSAASMPRQQPAPKPAFVALAPIRRTGPHVYNPRVTR